MAKSADSTTTLSNMRPSQKITVTDTGYLKKIETINALVPIKVDKLWIITIFLKAWLSKPMDVTQKLVAGRKKNWEF